MAQYDRKDHFYQRAKAEGRASRAAYKLDELQHRFRLVRAGDNILDLGCAPGGWLETLAKWATPRGKVIGIDRVPVTISLKDHVTVITENLETIADEPERIRQYIDSPINCAFSDIAPNTSGKKFQDQIRSLNLARLSWDCASQFLGDGGHFVVKIFEGPDVSTFRSDLKSQFKKVTTVDPKATRKGSCERYFVCQDFRP